MERIKQSLVLIRKLKTQKSELEGEKIESERMCEEKLRKKDQAYQREIIEKDDAIREAERQCGESDENSTDLSDALSELSDQLDTILTTPHCLEASIRTFLLFSKKWDKL